MSKNPILKHFVSDADLFLESIRKQYPNLSNSQLKEQKKYQRIYALRDKDGAVSNPPLLAGDFLNTDEK